jgi:predicted transcriptional regulator
MRTTIELKPEHRARLLELAARRGQKGFSFVIQEAVDAYLKTGGERDRQRQRALSLRGCLPVAEAKRLRRETAELRGFWR